jgi:carboxyl-terminal processing protease
MSGVRRIKGRTLLFISIIVIATAALVGGYVQSPRASRVAVSNSSLQSDVSQGFEEALVAVQEAYAGATDLEQLSRSSIQGMLHQLDPHSSFFTKTEWDELQTEQQSRIYGIGVTIVKRHDRVYIISAVPGTPAQREGLRYGDAIAAIDGQSVEDWSSDQVMHRVRGEKGDAIEITVERAGAPEPITVRIRRDEVKLPTVRNAFMTTPPGTGYIGLTGGFSSKTDEELTAAITRLKQDGMRALILDLRGNPGGLLDQAVDVAKKFLAPRQTIVEIRGREDRFPTRTYVVPDDNEPETMPVVVLINRQTASASEVVAGALQDHDRALIVGENSFGKGLVQSVNTLRYGAGLTLTTQKYYTPSGRSIQRDYSNVSIYDYYLNRTKDGEGAGTAKRDVFLTDMKQQVFGGAGITPNIEIKSPDGPIRGKLVFGIFDFVRQLTAAQIQGFRHYRIADTQYRSRLTPEDIARYPITEELLAAFRQYVSTRPHFNITDEQYKANLVFIRSQMLREIITAAYGPEAGDQVYLADDLQMKKAIESLPQARLLADNVRRTGAERQ